MTIEWVENPPQERFVEVLREQRPGHYPEFLTFLEKELGAARARAFRGHSGALYRLRLTEEKHAVVERAGGEGDPGAVDRDLWPLLEWLIEGVDGEWTLEALRNTGALYRAPVDS